jgi:hypothetical protein
MENLKKIKEDLFSLLVKLNDENLTPLQKIKISETVVIETINFIDPLIQHSEMTELYEDVAHDLFRKRHYNSEVIKTEFRGGDAHFQFCIGSNDYSTNTYLDVIREAEIKKELILRLNAEE